MDEVFREYSEFYDILYGDKNYSAECDFLEEIFLRFSKKPIKKILDIGCGTGGHALHLAQRRYDVTGIDRSEEMLKIAQEKASRENLSIKFKQADVRTFSLNDKFDAVIAMFAVMGYQKTNEDIEAAVRSVRKHLEPGNLFIFDVWFGPAVISEKPSERVKFLEQGGEKIIRIAQPQLDL
ncbi:MAG: methyltransferase domain-containing protein, partial [Candidatus Dadabacteria bacterium]|nr:methyltransferase domain-containing protein [Candidatus Dadabacteria bacterium]NIQ16925.1 methyltransferase domain-containing protein [Candidatus Dadabacteria bacterium]